MVLTRRCLPVLAALAFAACTGGDGSQSSTSDPSNRSTPKGPALPGSLDAASYEVPHFEEVAEASGIDLVHSTGSLGGYEMPAVMGGGACAFDVEGDGDLDLLFVGGRPGRGGSEHRLFLQQGPWQFEEATSGSGLEGSGWGMGCAVGDVDGDGAGDLLITAAGDDALFINESTANRASFRDVSRSFGLVRGGWSTSARFADFDRDGDLDLFVARYLDWDSSRTCSSSGRPDFCGPTRFSGLPDLLYRNQGGRTFEEISVPDIAASNDHGLGVEVADFDGDGWLDIYVANDADPNHLWRNSGGEHFTDEALFVGLAFNRYGVGEASMGIALGDSDLDGDIDVFLSHLIEETNTLYENRGVDGFEDVTSNTGLGLASLGLTGFGNALFDADRDGDLDIAVVNGAVKRRGDALSDRQDWFWSAFAEPNLLFLNDGAGRFVDVSARVPSFSGQLEVSRALLSVDLDADGDLDLVVTNLGGPARLYRNDQAGEGEWLAVRAQTKSGASALGARFVVRSAGRTRAFVLTPPGGYLSGGEAPLVLSFNQAVTEASFDVHWPGGGVETFSGQEMKPASLVTLVEGSGNAPGGAAR